MAQEVIVNNGSTPLEVTGPPGIARNRWCNVVHNTLPTSAGTGTVTFGPPGVRGLTIDSIYIVAGSVPLTNTNWRIRYAVDAINDAEEASLLPVTEPGHGAAADIGQVRSFNVTPVVVPDTEAAGDLRVIGLALPAPVVVDVSTPISRLGFVHNLGAGVTIQLGISALEAVS